MKYPSLGTNRQYQVSLPQLSGGVNYSVLPHLIADNQLSDVKNLWFRDGVLKTRPGISYLSKIIDKSTSSPENVTFDTYSSEQSRAVITYSKTANGKYSTHVLFDGSESFDFVDQEEQVVPWFCESNVNAENGGDNTLPLMYCRLNGEGRVFAIDNNGVKSEVRPYIPTVMTNGIPKPNFKDKLESVLLEPYNMLTGYYKCKYTSSGQDGKYFRLPKGGISYRLIVSVTNRRGDVTEYMLDANSDTEKNKETNNATDLWIQKDRKDGVPYLVADPTEGVFWFSVNNNHQSPIAFAETGIANDILATVETKNNEENDDTIYGMKFSTWYGGGLGLSGGVHLFVSGNKNGKNLVHWSAVNNPLYFPEKNCSYIGSDNKEVTAFGKQEDMLVVFKAGELYYLKYYDGETATAEQLENQEVIDTEAGRSLFMSVQLHPSIGCDKPKTICLCNNRLVWFNGDGKVYGLFSANQYSERNVRELSLCVERELKKALERSTSVSAAEFENHYLLFFGNTIFAMDYSSSGFVYFASYSSDEKSQKAVQWYRWEIENGSSFVDAFNQSDDVVIVERKGNVFLIYRFTVPEENKRVDDGDYETTHGINSMFETKLFDFGRADRYKRVNPFYLQMGGEKGNVANLAYLNENGRHADAYKHTMSGASVLNVSPARVTPNMVRVRLFGIRVECDGFVEIGGLILNYSVMGTVR